MILKIRRENAWEYLDHIEQVTIVKSGNAPVGVTSNDYDVEVHYCKNGESVMQLIPNDSYLLNDNGKTIERIA